MLAEASNVNHHNGRSWEENMLTVKLAHFI